MRQFFARLMLAVFFFYSIASPLSAQENNKEDLQNKIHEYENKLVELRSQKNSLSTQIQFMDAQIYLTSLKIEETETEIVNTQKEIELLTNRIEGLDQSLNHLSRLLIKRVVDGYKKKEPTFIDLLLDSDNADDLINRAKYVKVAQRSNQKIIVQVQVAKLNFEEQKKLREDKKTKLAELEKKLISQRTDLNYQKSQKQILLRDTQNDELKYQQLLSQAIAEFNAIQKAIATGSVIGPVKRGDPIALVGNSGYPNCSTGAHLHFEVRQGGSWVDPLGYLSSKSVTDRQVGGSQTIGSGSWDWPLQDPVIVEQHFGQTPWSYRYTYSGGIHTGLDMWSDASEVIRAPADGTLYTSSQNCSGPIINIKYIDHGGGLMTFYLHVQ